VSFVGDTDDDDDDRMMMMMYLLKVVVNRDRILHKTHLPWHHFDILLRKSRPR